MKKKPIPTFIIEEHHEAFIVWNYAIQQGLIPPTGNTLFHVDEHSDMGTPRFNTSIHNLNGDINAVKDFSYNELNIASFIMPAIYRGIFNQVHWIKQRHRIPEVREEKMFIRSYNQSGEKLISGKIKQGNKKDSINDIKEFDYFLQTIEQIGHNKKVILDIDLDYFSCNGNPNELKEIYINVTKDEFDHFNKNKYHRLNFQNFRIESIQKDSKYYYVLNNYSKIYPCPLYVDEQEIITRIKRFTNKLYQNKIRPILIDLCRSRYSGYTPEEQYHFIEDQLINQLLTLSQLNIVNDWL